MGLDLSPPPPPPSLSPHSALTLPHSGRTPTATRVNKVYPKTHTAGLYSKQAPERDPHLIQASNTQTTHTQTKSQRQSSTADWRVVGLISLQLGGESCVCVLWSFLTPVTMWGSVCLVEQHKGGSLEDRERRLAAFEFSRLLISDPSHAGNSEVSQHCKFIGNRGSGRDRREYASLAKSETVWGLGVGGARISLNAGYFVILLLREC